MPCCKKNQIKGQPCPKKLVIFILEMSNEEDNSQKRREKIMARFKEENQEEEQKESTGPSVFQRYKSLKDRQKMQEKLTDVSKGIGIVIVLVGMLFPPEAVFSAIFVIMLGAALKISGQTNTKSTSDDLKFLGKLGTILGKFHYLDRLYFLLQISLNVFLSYLVAAVLVNVLILSSSHLSLEL